MTNFPLQRVGQRAEAKISCIYVFFVIFILLSKTHDAILLSERDSYRDAVNSYFLCEANGYVPGRCSRETFEQYSRPTLSIFRTVMRFFVPLMIVLYLFNCRALKAKAKKINAVRTLRSVCSRRAAFSSSSSNVTSTS